MIDKFEADAAIRGLFGMMNPPRIEALVAFVMQVQEDAAAQPDALIKRICDAIRAADSKSVDEADYMFDSDDCIKIIETFATTAPSAVEQEKKRSDRIEDGRFEQARNDARHGVLR